MSTDRTRRCRPARNDERHARSRSAPARRQPGFWLMTFPAGTVALDAFVTVPTVRLRTRDRRGSPPICVRSTTLGTATICAGDEHLDRRQVPAIAGRRRVVDRGDRSARRNRADDPLHPVGVADRRHVLVHQRLVRRHRARDRVVPVRADAEDPRVGARGRQRHGRRAGGCVGRRRRANRAGAVRA